MIFEELHTYLETTRSELSHDVFTVDKSSLSGEGMKREERFALFSFFENLIEMSPYMVTSVDCQWCPLSPPVQSTERVH